MDRKVPYMILGENGQWVEEFLKMPSLPPFLALGVKSSMSHVAQNKEVEKQDAMATFQLLEKYYQGVVNLMGIMPQMQDPAMREVTLKIMKASGEKVKRVLETYGEMVPEEYTGVTDALTAQIQEQVQTQMQLPGTQGGPPPGPPPPEGGPVG